MQIKVNGMHSQEAYKKRQKISLKIKKKLITKPILYQKKKLFQLLNAFYA